MRRKDPIIDNLVSEYETLVAEATDSSLEPDWERMTGSLVTAGEWTPPAAAHLVALVREYGSFMLRNAYALALTLDIEDGELGF